MIGIGIRDGWWNGDLDVTKSALTDIWIANNKEDKITKMNRDGFGNMEELDKLILLGVILMYQGKLDIGDATHTSLKSNGLLIIKSKTIFNLY